MDGLTTPDLANEDRDNTAAPASSSHPPTQNVAHSVRNQLLGSATKASQGNTGPLRQAVQTLHPIAFARSAAEQVLGEETQEQQTARQQQTAKDQQLLAREQQDLQAFQQQKQLQRQQQFEMNQHLTEQILATGVPKERHTLALDASGTSQTETQLKEKVLRDIANERKRAQAGAQAPQGRTTGNQPGGQKKSDMFNRLTGGQASSSDSSENEAPHEFPLGE